jgi:hypothetical protein
MTVNDVYLLIQFIVKKGQSGDLTPSEFNRVINAAQRQYLSYLLGDFQTYTPGRPIAKVELGNNAIVRQRLAPVIKRTTLVVAAGLSTYPADFLQTDAMWQSGGTSKIRYCEQERLDATYNSAIDPIATNPIYLLEDTGFRFYPTTIATPVLSYVSNPADIVWGYTLDGNNRPVYDVATSVQPVWDDTSMMEIIAKALKMVGVNLQAAQVVQYANDVEKMGQ